MLQADAYGNVVLDARARGSRDLPGCGAGRRSWSGGRLAHYATTFADVPAGELLLYEDGFRALSLAGMNRGSALAQLGLALDDELLIAPVAS